jgi:hypothetical protein
MFPSISMTLSGRCFLRKNVFCTRYKCISGCMCTTSHTYLRVKHDASPLVDPEVLFHQTAILHWEQAVRETYQPFGRGHPSGYVGGGKRKLRWQKTGFGGDRVIILQPKATSSESEFKLKSGSKSKWTLSAQRTALPASLPSNGCFLQTSKFVTHVMTR